MKINQIIVNESMGGTCAGAVATVESPMGSVQTRSPVKGLQPAEKVIKGKSKKKGPYQNSIVEGKKDKVAEAELQEDDLIVIPGHGMKRKTGFIQHGQSRVDHEVDMARSDLIASYKNAKAIFDMLKGRSEEEGIEGWVQEKLIKAADYLNAVKEYLDGKMAQESIPHGGVIAGGGVGEGVVEGKVINSYLWHGSRQKIPMLEPRQAVDTGGAAGSNQNAIYATSDPKVAIAMGLTTPGSDTGMFPNDPQMVLFSGKIRKGEYVYLHKLPFKGPDGKPQFVQGGHSREYHTIPSVKGIKPIEIKKIPVNKYLNLIRKATPADLKLRKKYKMKKAVKEVVNPDIFDKNISKEPTPNVPMGDFEFRARPFRGRILGYGNPNDEGVYITALDPKKPIGQNIIGHAQFVVKSDEKGDQWLESAWTEVDDDYVGRGVAAMMYAFAKSLGNDIKPSPHQSTFGKWMWKKWGKDAKHLVGEQGVAEGSVISMNDNPAIIKRLAKQWWTGNEQQHAQAQLMLNKMGWDIYEDEDDIILSKNEQEYEIPMDELEGVAEGSVLKSIKRGLQGWDKTAVGPSGENLGDPKEIVKRAKAMDTDTAKTVRAGLDDASKHSPAGLQRRVLDRKLKGVAEAQVNEKFASQQQAKLMYAVAGDKDVAKKTGVSQKVAKEFIKKSHGQKVKSLPKKVKKKD